MSALAGLGVSLLGAGLGAALGGKATEGNYEFRDTKATTQTQFLDPAQLQQILSGLNNAEQTGRGDISAGVNAALGILQGNPNLQAQNSAIKQQAIQNKLSDRAGDQDTDTFLKNTFLARLKGNKSRNTFNNMMKGIERRGELEQMFDRFKKKYTDELIIDDSAMQSAEGQVRQSNSQLFASENGDSIDPFLRSNQALNLGALNQMAAFSGLEGSDGQVALSPQEIQARLEQTPGYQFRFNQGNQAVERSASSRGLLESGAILKGLTEFGQGLASQEFGAEHARLASLAGQTSNAALTGASQDFQSTQAQAGLMAGQGEALSGITQQAAQQRGNALLQGGLNTNRQVQSQLTRV